MEITITGSIPSKKNSKRIVMFGKRPAIIGSKNYLDWKKTAMMQLTLDVRKQAMPHVIYSKVQSITITLFSDSMRKGDMTNKCESLMDLLVDGGVITDDNWFVVPKLTLLFGGVDRENPRATIKIV